MSEENPPTSTTSTTTTTNTSQQQQKFILTDQTTPQEIIQFLQLNKDDPEAINIVKEKIDGYTVKNSSIDQLRSAGNTITKQYPIDSINEFWRNLHQVNFENLLDRECPDEPRNGPFLLELNKGYLLGNYEKGSKLIVRQCYIEIYKKYLSKIGTENLRFLVIGNPVKSNDHFTRDVPTENAVFFTYDNDGNPIANMVNYKEFIRLSFNPQNTIYIVDSETPIAVSGLTILLSSPDQSLYKNFRKQQLNIDVYYMAVWTDSEMTFLYDNIFSHINLNTFIRDNYRWGNIPRQVFQKSGNLAEQNLLEESIKVCDVKNILNSKLGIADSPDYSQKILHMIPDDGNRGFTLDFGSRYIALEILKKFNEVQNNKMLSEMKKKDFLHSSLGGTYFEAMGHITLTKSSTNNFRMRELGKQQQQDEIRNSVQIISTTTFYEVNELNNVEKNVYCIPIKKNFVGVDAIIFKDQLIQFSLSEDHPIKGYAMKDIIECMENHGAIDLKLVFIVPKSIYTTFPLQSIKTETKLKKISNKLKSKLENIKQFVMCFDYDF
eukprot:gene7429-9131_t